MFTHHESFETGEWDRITLDITNTETILRVWNKSKTGLESLCELNNDDVAKLAGLFARANAYLKQNS